MKNKSVLKSWRLIPIIVFIALIATFIYRLAGEDPSFIPSVLIAKPLPEFELNKQGDNPSFKSTDFIGDQQPKLINFWASWCVPCRQEHPQLKQLQQMGIKVYGISYKDTTENALKFLSKYGNVYEAIGIDPKNRIHIDLGVHKIPETFIVDNQGIIRYKQTGAILPGENLENFLTQFEAAKTPIKQ